uniref:Glycosyltransferase 2-like domain-containing protein n=1 Tax=viral metagenome TaxID=1070528 RepID=A0A6C0DNT0_9ZZZZ
MEHCQTIGAYYQCHKNPYATFHCLFSFRSHYPDSTIVLISDNGYDYSEMAKCFNCIYIHDNSNAKFISTHQDIISGSHIENMNRLIERVKTAFILIKEDYVIWLEDDVFVRNKIQEQFHYDLNGFCPNMFSRFTILKLKENYPFLEEKEYRYSGHGGSVFKKQSLLESFENKTRVEELLRDWLEIGFYELCQDVFFSLLLTLNKKNVGPYMGHQDFFIENMIVAVQHQYKNFYGLPMPEELKYLVKVT